MMHCFARSLTACLVGSAVLTGLQVSAAAQQLSCYDYAPADQIIQGVQSRRNLPGAGLAIQKLNGPSTMRFYGAYNSQTIIPIASGSKLVSACVLLRLVDEGKLKLDDPVSKYLPSFTGTKGSITLRQCFSHTSGLPGSHWIISAKNITLAQAVDYVGKNVALRASPGTEFYYGGVSMSVAGRICEIVSGKGWEQLVQDKLETPLGVTSLDYQGLGATTNYRVAGSVQCRLEDYQRILDMLLHDGVYGSTRVLSSSAVQTMFANQTAAATIVYTPQPDQRPYGIGVWLDRRDSQGKAQQISSQGAFGFSPWIDLEREFAGIVMVKGQLNKVAADVDLVQAWSRQELSFGGAACYGVSTSLCGTRLRLLSDRPLEAGLSQFSLVASGVGSGQGGIFLFGTASQPSPLLGVQLLIALSPPPIAVSATSDGLGRAVLSFPIPATAQGATLACQTLWLGNATCGSSGVFGASTGLRLVVR